MTAADATRSPGHNGDWQLLLSEMDDDAQIEYYIHPDSMIKRKTGPFSITGQPIGLDCR